MTDLKVRPRSIHIKRLVDEGSRFSGDIQTALVYGRPTRVERKLLNEVQRVIDSLLDELNPDIDES